MCGRRSRTRRHATACVASEPNVAVANARAVPATGSNAPTTSKNTANDTSPPSRLRRSRRAAAGPSWWCVNADRIVTATGNGARRPLERGPTAPAMCATTHTNTAATAMRTGMSHAGACVAACTPCSRGMERCATTTAPQASTNVSTSDARTCPSSQIPPRYVIHATALLASHPVRSDDHAYTTAYATSATIASRTPALAWAANGAPCSRVSTRASGPDVSGSAANHPPASGPWRRVIALATPISAGERSTRTPTDQDVAGCGQPLGTAEAVSVRATTSSTPQATCAPVSRLEPTKRAGTVLALKPVLPRCEPRLALEHASEVALVRESGVEGDLGKGGVGRQRAAREVDACAPQVLADRAAERATELPSEVYGMDADGCGDLGE